MPRVSQKLLANRLKFAADALGMRVAKSWNDVGGLQLGQSYGGVQIEVVHNEHGGIGTIGPRMRATDMADALQIVSDLIRVRDDTRFQTRARELGYGPDWQRNPRKKSARKSSRRFKLNPSDREAADTALFAKFGSAYEALTPRKKSALIGDVISFALHEHVTDPHEAVTLLHKRIHGAKNLESYSRTLLASGPARTGMR